MNPRNPISCLALLAAALASLSAQPRPDPALPRLEKRGAATPLILESQARGTIAAAAGKNQSGSGPRFSGPNPGVQHVKLYRYR
ncbi:MAG: hypothetical protein HY736_21915 [Verrucomicrobia bacterium]|nr:hypothetical protein [Verrucomicrobiota bacterium]